MSTTSLVPCLLLVFLLIFPYGSLSSNIYHIHPHIFLHSLSLLATNNFLLPTLLFFISLHILLLAYYSVIGLFPFLTSYSLVYISFLSLILSFLLSAIYLFLILFLLYPLLIFLLLLLQLNYKFIVS